MFHECHAKIQMEDTINIIYKQIYMVVTLLIIIVKNTADQDSRYKSWLSSKQNECSLKVILLLKVSSHGFESTFIMFRLN